ncbi:hypothetical protein LCGC14_2247940 [marine sediment metagenome]|uniref:Uncharacterized protein n=1 Tax=marine sediment metagenome TaxID=412755 RepID=A0A0F9DQW7_9ZZZZ
MQSATLLHYATWLGAGSLGLACRVLSIAVVTLTPCLAPVVIPIVNVAAAVVSMFEFFLLNDLACNLNRLVDEASEFG